MCLFTWWQSTTRWQPFWISTYLTMNEHKICSKLFSRGKLWDLNFWHGTTLHKFEAVECIKCCTTLFWQWALAPYTSNVSRNYLALFFRGWFEKRKSWDMRKYNWRSLFHSIRKKGAHWTVKGQWQQMVYCSGFGKASDILLFFCINFRFLFFQKCHHEQCSTLNGHWPEVHKCIAIGETLIQSNCKALSTIVIEKQQ